MRALVLATTALAVLALAVPSRAQTTDPVVAIVNGTQIKKSDVEAAYATLPEQYRQMPLEQIYDPLLEQVVEQHAAAGARPTSRISPTIPRSRRSSPGRMTACCATAVVKKAIDAGRHRREAEGRLRGDEEPAGLRVRGDARRAHPGRRRGAGAGDHQAAPGRGRFRDAGQGEVDRPLGQDQWRRSRLSSAARRWCPSSPRPRSRSQPGTIGDKPVKSQFGWHVIKVEDRRQTVPTFEEKEPELREQLSREIVTALLADVRNGRHDRALQHRRHAQAAK